MDFKFFGMAHSDICDALDKSAGILNHIGINIGTIGTEPVSPTALLCPPQ